MPLKQQKSPHDVRQSRGALTRWAAVFDHL